MRRINDVRIFTCMFVLVVSNRQIEVAIYMYFLSCFSHFDCAAMFSALPSHFCDCRIFLSTLSTLMVDKTALLASIAIYKLIMIFILLC